MGQAVCLGPDAAESSLISSCSTRTWLLVRLDASTPYVVDAMGSQTQVWQLIEGVVEPGQENIVCRDVLERLAQIDVPAYELLYLRTKHHLSDRAVIENRRCRRTLFALYRAGRWTLQDAIDIGADAKLIPFSANNNLIKNEVVLLPSEPRIYGSEAELIAELDPRIDQALVQLDLMAQLDLPCRKREKREYFTPLRKPSLGEFGSRIFTGEFSGSPKEPSKPDANSQRGSND